VEMGSWELFAQAGLEPHPPDLSFPSSWDYRCEPTAPDAELTLVTKRIPRSRLRNGTGWQASQMLLCRTG
jgi:hypothetical protein